MLLKTIYLYEYMDDWKKFSERFFYIHLSMKDIIVGDYKHAKRVYKDFETKNLGEYHDFYA